MTKIHSWLCLSCRFRHCPTHFLLDSPESRGQSLGFPHHCNWLWAGGLFNLRLHYFGQIKATFRAWWCSCRYNILFQFSKTREINILQQKNFQTVGTRICMEKIDIIEGLNDWKSYIFAQKWTKLIISFVYNAKKRRFKKAWLKKNIRKKLSRQLRDHLHHKYRRYFKVTVSRDFQLQVLFIISFP
jgi:hypothetical protein